MNDKQLLEAAARAAGIHMRPESQCPNCGKMAECGFSSSGIVKVGSGSYGSTLYGVCQDCADNHKAYMDSMAAACDPHQQGDGDVRPE